MMKNSCKQLWEEFIVELSGLGPRQELLLNTYNLLNLIIIFLAQVWIHYKASIKKKLAKNKRNSQATGGALSQ